MTPQELKNSILQLAIQGKLVEQRPEEGTAEELYQQIQEEKQKLIKEGKIKKEKNLPVITADEIPFEIPESWKWLRLRDMTSVLGDGIHGTPVFDDAGDYYFVNGNNLVKGNIVFKADTKKVSSSEYEKYKKPLDKNTILISINGSIGNYAFYTGEPIILGKSACYFSVLSGIDKEFVCHLLNTKFFMDYAVKEATQTTIKNVSLKAMRMFPFPLPPLAEQKRIVAKIEELLPYIDRYEKAWSRLEDLNKRFPVDMQKSILQMAIQGKLVEQRPEEGTAEELYKQIQKEKKKLIKGGKIKKGKPLPEITEDEIPFDIPVDWIWIKLGEIVSVLGGKRIPAGRTLTADNTGYKYIRVSDMKNGSVSAENLLYVPTDIYPSISRYVIHKEDVYITVAGTIGRVGKIPPEIDGANLTENADRLVFSIIDQDWLIKCLESSLVQQQIIDATTKVGQPKLAIKRIQELLIPLPPLAEQKRIVAKLEEILPLCERLK